MYAVYSYKSTATTAQILRDLIMLLTGTTDLGLLSASCDVATSSIDSTFGVGLNNDHDAAASANLTQGLRMSVWDNTSEYFYPSLTITTTTLQIGLWDSWNGTTHVGVAPGASSSSTATLPGTVGTAAGKLYIWTDGKALLITGNNGYPLSITQITRDDLWRTVAGGYKPVVCGGAIIATTSPTGAWAAGTPFVLKNINNVQAVVNAGTAYSNVLQFQTDVPASIPTTAFLSATLSVMSYLQPLRAGSNNFSNAFGWGGSITEVSPIYYLNSAALPAYADDITFGAEKYKIMGGVYSKICVRVQ